MKDIVLAVRRDIVYGGPPGVVLHVIPDNAVGIPSLGSWQGDIYFRGKAVLSALQRKIVELQRTAALAVIHFPHAADKERLLFVQVPPLEIHRDPADFTDRLLGRYCDSLRCDCFDLLSGKTERNRARNSR